MHKAVKYCKCVTCEAGDTLLIIMPFLLNAFDVSVLICPSNLFFVPACLTYFASRRAIATLIRSERTGSLSMDLLQRSRISCVLHKK